MKKITSTILFAETALTLTTAIFAATPKDKGIYIDGNIGYAQIQEAVKGSHKKDNDGLGWNINAGYKLNPNFAVEGGYLQFPDESFDMKIKGKENHAVSIAAKGILPTKTGFSFFGKLGAAVVNHKLTGPVNNKGTHEELAALAGAGMSYAFTQNLEGNIQGAITSKVNKVPSMYLLSFGIGYIF